MSTSAHTGKVLDENEFSAIVRGWREELADRYEKYALDMAKIGEPDLADIFRLLIKDLSADVISKNRTGAKAADAYTPDATAVSATERTGMRGLWSAYSIWTFAVRNETQRFEELTSLNIPMDAQDLRSTLAVEARACLDRAARYRAQRRLAFHADRLANKIAQFPDVRRIDTVEDFAHVALAIERYFLALMRRLSTTKSKLADIIDATESDITELEQTAGATEVPSRLKNALKRLENASRNPRIAVGASAGIVTKVALEANRLFEFYDRVFETSQDPQVTDAAQHLAVHVIERLRILKKLRFGT